MDFAHFGQRFLVSGGDSELLGSDGDTLYFADAAKDDQVRVTTPEGAKELGSDYIVVGRPITKAEDPVAAYERCCAEFIG